jgi:foldase protein PrsA
VRVGSYTISEKEIADQIVALSPERQAPDPPRFAVCADRHEALQLESVRAALVEECRHEYRALKQRALDFLISSAWLIGETAERGVPVPAGVGVKRQRQLAGLWIRQMLEHSEVGVTKAQVAAFYSHHIERFEHPERRYIYAVESLTSEAAALRLMREAIGGKSIADISVHEPVERSSGPMTKLARAVFAVKPHAISGPVAENRHFYVFEVTRVVPASRKPLARVAHSIGAQLRAARRRATLARFIRSWRRKWVARTDCAAGFVIQSCRQYDGPMRPEDLSSFS